MKPKLMFGPAGTPHSAKECSSKAGIERISELGLDCMELEFVQGVRMGSATAKEINKTVKKTGVRLTVHGPYYINLNAREPEKLSASKKRILDSARIGHQCGAESVTFHPAYYFDEPKEKVFKTVLKQFEDIIKTLQKEKNPIWVRPETTGKGTQFGSLDELIDLSLELEQVQPCIDFSHLHARSNGKWNSYDEFRQILEKVEKKLGKKALECMHIHLSGIAYGEKGEKHHLVLREADMKYPELLKVLKEFNVGGFLICESPNLEEDAMLLQKTYREV